MSVSRKPPACGRPPCGRRERATDVAIGATLVTAFCTLITPYRAVFGRPRPPVPITATRDCVVR